MAKEKEYGMGYIRDPPHPDAPRLLTEKQAAALPSSYFITDPTPVEDQGGEGSCTGNAADNEFKIRAATLGAAWFNGARQQIYQCALAHDGNPLQDVGSSLSTVAWVLQNIGVAPESDFPYTGGMQGPVPTKVLTDAKKDEATQILHLDAANEATTILNIKAALVPNDVIKGAEPVMFGYNCYDAIFSVGSDGQLPMPSGAVAGGHANCIVGYDDTHGCLDSSKGAFVVKNSWGTGWGMKYAQGASPGGYMWMSYTYFLDTDDAVGDCIAVVSESGSTPDRASILDELVLIFEDDAKEVIEDIKKILTCV
jgi:C1A family cysteine protease